MTVRLFRWGLLAAFLLQAALLAWMIADRAILLSQGREIRLAVVPVDPRDLLRGDYVTLAYPISRLRSDEVGGDDAFTYQEPIYVSLREAPGGWQAISIHREPPDTGVFLRGTVEDTFTNENCAVSAPCREVRIAYNLERFFVPEGEGRALEFLRNDQRISVDVAVAESGRAALKRLLVDGEVRYQESLY
jgi:uncharacterized membrane-anchored protein